MNFNYSKLRGRIVEHNGTIAQFCRENNLSQQIISKKLNNFSSFSVEDILAISEYLDIPKSEIPDYFFVKEV